MLFHCSSFLKLQQDFGYMKCLLLDPVYSEVHGPAVSLTDSSLLSQQQKIIFYVVTFV